MQEEFNELPFDGPGGNKEGNEVNGPKGQRIDMDQTNFETSDAKRELVDADKELGSQIDKAATELSENISEVEKDAKKNIEEVKSSLSDKLKDVEQEISDAVKAIDAVTGVDSSSLPTYLKQLKDEFVTNQAEWTKTVQNIEDEDNMTEEEVIATNALKYYGWDFSTPGFLSYLDRGTEANFGTISTEQFEEYSKHVDGLIEGLNDMESEMSELQEKIDVLKAIEDRTPEQEQDLAEAEEEMDSLKVETSKSSKALRRITDVDPLSGEFGVKDQDGCRQYLWDTASSDEQEYRDRLANELVGYGAKAGYYKNLEAGFRAEADTWKMVKAEIADKEANGEELTPKEQAEKFASENFEQKYGFTANAFAVLTWNEGNDDALGFVVAADNGIWEEYERHFNNLGSAIAELESEVSDLLEQIAELEAIEDRTPEQEEDLVMLREEADDKKMMLSDSNDRLRRISSADDVDETKRVKSQAGSFAYYSDERSDEFKSFKHELANEIVGYGAKAGYYKNLEAGFRAEADTWKMVKAEIADKEANGEELTPKEQAEKFASENFEQKYGFTANAFAVLTWNEGNDDALGFVVAADNGIWEEYERHFNNLGSAIAELESEVSDLLEQIAELEAIEDRTPEQEEDLVMLREEADAKKMMLSDKSSELFRISSADDVDETKRVVSQAGSFAYYSDLQDADTKSYREQQSHMIGFESPSEEVSKVKEELESRIKQSEEIINDSENYEAEEVEAAKRFITAVGTNVTVVSLSTYQDIVHEEEKAAAEAREAIRLAETFNSMADEIAAQAKTYSFRNLNVYPLPNGEAIEFTIENPEGLVFEILKVDVNGITQTEGKQVIFGEGSITMAPGILLERGDSIDVVVKVEGSVEIKPVEPKFGEYEFPGDSTCIARDAILTSMKKAKTSLVESKDGLNSDNEGFSSKTQFYTSEQVDFEQSMKDAEADIEDNEKELSEAIEELDNVSDVIDNKSDSIEDKEGLINQNQTTVNNNISLVSSHTSQIEVKNAEILELEADPYPDTEKIESLKDEIKSMEEDIADAEKENEDLIKVIDEDTQVLAELKKDLAELQNTSSELEEQIATINHKVAALKDDRLFYEGVIRVITLNLAIYTKAIESTTEAIVQVQKEIDEASTSIEDYTKESDRLGCGEK